MAVSEKINALLQIRGAKKYELAEYLEMSPQSLRNKFTRGSFSAEDLIKISDFLGCTLGFEIDEKQKIVLDKTDLRKKGVIMKKKIIYEVSMSILAIIAVVLALLDIGKGLNSRQILVDNIILLIFILDYFIRLVTSDNKKKFVRSNILDLVAIIPFNSAFRMFRIFKLVKLTRLLKVSKLTKLFRLFAYIFRVTDKLKTFFNTNGFKYMLIITSVFICLGGIAIHYAENMSFSDGIWWAFVTATTVGYGDISPSTTQGRAVAMVLMLIGIGLIGSLTSTITSFFLNASIKNKPYSDEILCEIKSKLDNIKTLSDEDIDTICNILKTLNK